MKIVATAIALIAMLAMTVSAADTQPSDQAKPDGTVKGKVIHQGKPLSGVRVAIFAPKDRKHGKNGDEEQGAKDGVAKIFGKGDRPKPVAQTVTDANGEFSLSVAAGKYIVAASGGKKIGMAHERIEVKAGETTSVDLTLQDRPGGKNGKKGRELPTTQP
ncbi:MAG TPA: carboxypeptidase-like regulatory domain-containing protein [Tepidisphaeraceae bacterium]|nr:carboxypeptidase-like regulatory domain-containing protein [Tepidisphaeraceae bacterium]